MAREHLSYIVQLLRRLAGHGPAAQHDDAELLERFVTSRESEAFEALVQRHGPMVWAVCRRILEREHDAEDVFQAVFLVLAQKAASIRKRQSIASWLYGVTYRLSRKFQSGKELRKRHEKEALPATVTDPAREAVARETARIITEEVQRLPEKYRSAVVLCYLAGRTREEAAWELRWPIGTVKTRLSRALELLEKRLARRGLGLTVATALLGESAAEAVVPPALLATSTSAATGSLSGSATLPISAAAVRLAGQATRGIFLTRVRAVMLLLAGGILLAGGGALVLRNRVIPESGRAQLRPAPERREFPQPAPEPIIEAGEALLPANAAARLGSTTFLHGNLPREVAFTRDGKLLISADQSDAIHVWDVATGAEIRRFMVRRVATGNSVPLAGLVGLAVSPDSKFAAARCTWDTMVHVWDVSSGEELVRFAPELYSVTRVHFSPAGQLLAQWSFDASPGHKLYRNREPPVDWGNQPSGSGLCVWDSATGQVCDLVRFDLAGRTLSCGPDEALANWSSLLNRGSAPAAVDGKTLARLVLQQDLNVPISSLAEVFLGAGGTRNRPQEQRLRAGQLLGAMYHGPCSLSPDGNTLAAAAPAGDDSVVLFDLAQGKELYRLPRAGVKVMAFSPDGALLATAGLDYRVHLWDMATRKERIKPEGHSTVSFLAFSRDGTRLVSAEKDRSWSIWDVAGRAQISTSVPRQPRASICGVTADGHVLLVSNGPEMHLEDVFGAQPSRTIRARGRVMPPQGGASLFLNDGRTILYGGTPLSVCDSATGEHRGPFKLDLRWRPLNIEDQIVSVAVLPGESLLVLLDRVGIGHRLLFVDKNTCEVLVERDFSPEKASRYYSSVFSADSRTWAGVSSGRLGLWETCTGKLLLDISYAPGRFAKQVTFSPDGRFLAFEQVVGQDYLQDYLHLWDTATAQEVGRLGPLARRVTALAFSRDGRNLAAGFHKGELLLWHPPALDKAPGKQQPYSVSELEQLWSALGQPDSAGYRAAWALVAASEHAVALLNDRLRAVAETDPAQVRRLLADLQSRQDASQANAWADLERLGPGTEPEMRRARTAGAWPAERVRLEAFLKELPLKAHFPPPGEPLRRLRAVSVLEWIGTPEAKRVLESLARGLPTAEQTLYARAALGRLQAGLPGDNSIR